MDAPSCRLCGAALPEDGSLRCASCGLYQVADLGRVGYRKLAFGLAGFYVLTALLVLLTRG